jgi:hypothetical protein
MRNYVKAVFSKLASELSEAFGNIDEVNFVDK